MYCTGKSFAGERGRDPSNGLCRDERDLVLWKKVYPEMCLTKRPNVTGGRDEVVIHFGTNRHFKTDIAMN